MKPFRVRRLAAAIVAVAAASCAMFPLSAEAAVPQFIHAHSWRAVCGSVSQGQARCLAFERTDQDAKPNASGGPSGYAPADLRAAYSLPANNPGQLVAIVDAYDDPNAERDLGTYRSQFGLPACTTANGCFQKVNQNGGTSYPSRNSGWAEEMSLDLDMVSAACPNCHILLVEANSNSLDDLGTAVNRAVQMGAKSVSNSWGANEFGSEANYESAYFEHPGVAITASSGDNGYGAEFPAASRYVTAVGGTTLNPASNARGWTESAWNGSGSGCSAYIAKPSWQQDSGCSNRTINDVSVVADPNTGVAVYDSYGASGWMVFGGTSVGAPLIGAAYMLAGNTSVNGAASLYANAADLNDVTSGSNGSCSPSYLCTAGPGYDGPTGLGTPNGLGAFGAAAPTPNFSLGISPASQTVTAGGSTSYTVNLTAQNSYSSSVSLAVSGAPSGVTASFSSNSATPAASGTNVTLNVSSTSSAAAGKYTLTVTATGSDSAKTQHTASTSLTVNSAASPDYTLSATPSSRSVSAGGSTSYSVSLAPQGGYSSSVGLAVSGLPAGASASFNPTPVSLSSGSASSTLGVSTSATTPAGSYTLTITGTGNDSASTKHTTTVTLSVASAGDFSISVSPSSSYVLPGSNAQYTVTVTGSNGYGTPVSLSVSGLPSGSSGSFSPATVTPSASGASSTLAVSTTTYGTISTVTLTITATATDGSGLKHTTTTSATIL